MTSPSDTPERNMCAADLLKLEADRTYASLIEVGKKASAGSNAFFLYVTIATVVAFGVSKSDEIKIPMIGVVLDKWVAAEALIALATLSLYRYFAFLNYERVLSFKLKLLAPDQRMALWYVRYPSLDNYHFIVDDISKNARHIYLACRVLYPLLGILYPPALMLYCGIQGGWNVMWWSFTAFSALLIAYSAITKLMEPNWNDKSAVVRRLDML